MNQEEIAEFLGRRLLAMVSSADSDGNPHSVPVWFRYDGSAIQIWTGEGHAWVQQLRARPIAAITVCETQKPYSAAVLITGAVSVRHEDSEETMEEIRAITVRYVSESKVDGVVARFPDLRTIVSVRSDSVRAWDEF